MLFKLSNLNSNFALTPGYLNPALNNWAQRTISFKYRPMHADPSAYAEFMKSTKLNFLEDITWSELENQNAQAKMSIDH